MKNKIPKEVIIPLFLFSTDFISLSLWSFDQRAVDPDSNASLSINPPLMNLEAISASEIPQHFPNLLQNPALIADLTLYVNSSLFYQNVRPWRRGSKPIYLHYRHLQLTAGLWILELLNKYNLSHSYVSSEQGAGVADYQTGKSVQWAELWLGRWVGPLLPLLWPLDFRMIWGFLSLSWVPQLKPWSKGCWL